MTSEDVRAELDKRPFRPFRIHLVSGKEVEVKLHSAAFMMQNSILVFHDVLNVSDDVGYDMIALRNIERVEQLPRKASDPSLQ